MTKVAAGFFWFYGPGDIHSEGKGTYPYFCDKRIPMYQKNYRSTLLVAGLALLTLGTGACGSGTTGQQTAADSVAATAPSPTPELKWLAGKWQQTIKEGTLFENWEIVSQDSMAGVSGLINGKDTIVSERIALTFKEGTVIYSPTVNGQNNNQPVPFKLTRSTADSFIFENPAHDFPSMITYARINTDSMVATISGKPGGKPMSESFFLGRVSRN